LTGGADKAVSSRRRDVTADRPAVVGGDGTPAGAGPMQSAGVAGANDRGQLTLPAAYFPADADWGDVRLVQVTIPAGKRETLLAALDEEGVDYVVSDETSGRQYSAIAYVPLPTNAVEPVLDRLREEGLSDDEYTVVIDANTVVSRRFEELEERFEERENGERIARQELTTKATQLAPDGSVYALMTIISAVIATAGLLLDSPAVVVGSMVIAPLVGPALSASVGTVVGDGDMFRKGAKLQVAGVLLAIAAAAAFGLVIKHGQLAPPFEAITTVPEITERIAPDFLSLAVAVGAGAAGVISLMTGISTALVGVMIAAALIPPAAAVGIGIAWGQPLMALGAGVLVLVNLLSINLAALVVLWYAGYRPEHLFHRGEARRETLKRVTVLVVAILVLSAFLGGVTLDSINRASVEEQLRENAATVLETSGDRLGVNLELLNTEVTFENRAMFRNPTSMRVTVGVPPGEEVSGLAQPIDQLADTTAGTDIDTRVTYVSTEAAGGAAPGEQAPGSESLGGGVPRSTAPG
jgi:uncharacterized hydrophobic protein (TIGR00341 family)